MSLIFKHIEKVADLPASWDESSNYYYQQKSFLAHCEAYNPCKQRYIVAFHEDKLQAAAIIYTLSLNLLSFLRVKSPVKMRIVGVPCSVSCPGIFGNPVYVEELRKYIFKTQKGFVLFLNLEKLGTDKMQAKGKTLPTVVLQNPFQSWEHYLSCLRSDYRRRINKLSKEIQGIQSQWLPCSSFTEPMHKLYCDVFNKSKDKLEKLSFGFFKTLPEAFSLNVLSANAELLGWTISLHHNNTLFFFMGGLNYKENINKHSYMRLLISLVRRGIALNVQEIDFGQTAEIPKMRLGGLCKSKFMEASHSSPIILKLLKMSEGMLSYKKEFPDAHVFTKKAML